LQGIPFRTGDIQQIRFPQIVDLRFQINGLGILHGRLSTLPLGRDKRATARSMPAWLRRAPLN
jgi:hypothetical protein